MDDLEKHKATMRLPWTTGDFGALSRMFGQVTAEEFVAGLHGLEGQRVLDVACGSGAATLALASRAQSVVGLDLAPNLLDQARAAARAAGVQVHFDEGFAEDLPYQDASFDVATSVFGIIFSPFPETVVRELHRVVRPAGRLALTSWTPDSFSERSRRALSRHLPPSAPGRPEPFAWGNQRAVRELLTPYFTDLSLDVTPTRWEIPLPPRDAAVFFADNAGPLKLILEQLPNDGRARLLDAFGDYFEDQNEAPPGSGRCSIFNEYLRIIGTRR